MPKIGQTFTKYKLREQFINIYGNLIYKDVAFWESESDAFEYFDSLTKHNPKHQVALIKVTETTLAHN